MDKVRRDVWVLGGLLVVLIVLGIVLGNNQAADQRNGLLPKPTSYSADADGVKALYETLDRLGYSVTRKTTKLDTAPEDGVLFLLAPDLPISRAEWNALRAWLERGNVLIIGDSSTAVGPILGKPHTSASKPSCPSVFARGVRSFVVAEKDRIDSGELCLRESEGFIGFADSIHRPHYKDEVVWKVPLVPVFADDDGTTAAAGRVGRGTIIELCGCWGISNEGISSGDNLTMVLNAAGTAGRGGKITFDEYHHGYCTGQGMGSLLSTPAWLGLGAIGIGFLLVVVNGSCRFGRAFPLVEAARQRGEYLSSMSALLRKANATDLVVFELGGRFLRDCAEALGVSPGSGVDAILEAASKRRPEKVAELRDLCTAVTARQRYSEADVLVLANACIR